MLDGDGSRSAGDSGSSSGRSPGYTGITHNNSAGNGDLAYGAGALQQFRSRVHTMLAAFENSEAAPGKVAAHTVTRAHLSALGTPFPEADELHAHYRHVHTGLVNLSRTLTEQIDSLSIAVHGADVGFANLEEELRRRFWTIRSRTEPPARHEPLPKQETGTGT